jgi:hypothetical protein
MSNPDFLGDSVLSAQYPSCTLARTSASQAAETPRIVGWCATADCRLSPDTLNVISDYNAAQAKENMPVGCATRGPEWQGILDNIAGVVDEPGNL